MENVRMYQTEEGPIIVTDRENSILYDSRYKDFQSFRTELGKYRLVRAVYDEPSEAFPTKAFSPEEKVVVRPDPHLALAEVLACETFTVRSIKKIPREQYLEAVKQDKLEYLLKQLTGDQ